MAKFIQGLFYKNMPSKKLRVRNTKQFPKFFTKTYLQNVEKPIFVYTGTGSIDFDLLKKDSKIIKKLSKRDVEIYLYEPVSYYFKNHGYNLGYYSEFHSNYNNSKKLAAAELDSINKLGKKLGKITLNHCDYGLANMLGCRYSNIHMQCRDIFIRQAANCYMPLVDTPSLLITKKFWCGNGRYTIPRHMVMCYLADKLGNYSWWYESDMDWNIEYTWIEDLFDQEYLNKNNEILNSNKFFLEFKANTVKVHEKSGYYIPSGTFSSPNLDYKHTFDPCFVCIVNETRFAQPTANFSEKTLDAINYKKPFVVAAPPRTLEYLKKFGFKTFDKYWSEEYDRIENHSQRMAEIFKVIDYINSKSLDELNDMYRDMLDILQHNRNILKDLPTNTVIIDGN